MTRIYQILLLAGLSIVLPAMAQTKTCTRPLINAQGTDGVQITVGATAVVVLENNPGRCAFILKNVHASATMNCLPSLQGIPTATAGWTLAAGEQIKMTDNAAGGAWRCIQKSGASTVQVFEETN